MSRELVFLDAETTGTNPFQDRIIELSVAWFGDGIDGLMAGCTPDSLTKRFNPGIPIPAVATVIHGIKDSDVANRPKFSAFAASILVYLDGCDLAGYNLRQFDIPILEAEFARCGIEWDHKGEVIDCDAIFKKQQPRTLTAAVAHYCGRDHSTAHSAHADVLATIDVLRAQLKTPELKTLTLADVAKYSILGDSLPIDLAGKLVRDKEGFAVYNFGRSKGVRLADDQGLAYWMLDKDFPRNTLRHVREELDKINSVPASNDTAGEAGGDLPF